MFFWVSTKKKKIKAPKYQTSHPAAAAGLIAQNTFNKHIQPHFAVLCWITSKFPVRCLQLFKWFCFFETTSKITIFFVILDRFSSKIWKHHNVIVDIYTVAWTINYITLDCSCCGCLIDLFWYYLLKIRNVKIAWSLVRCTDYPASPQGSPSDMDSIYSKLWTPSWTRFTPKLNLMLSHI